MSQNFISYSYVSILYSYTQEHQEKISCNISNTVLTYAVYTFVILHDGRAIAQAVSRWLPTAAARVRARSGKVGFVMDKMALGQVFSEYFGFPCQSSFHQLLHNRPHLSSGAVQ
jgi:hypothetical protein